MENNCDIVYFPTNSAISLFDFSNIKKVNTLPPAADVENLHSTEEIKKIVYMLERFPRLMVRLK